VLVVEVAVLPSMELEQVVQLRMVEQLEQTQLQVLTQ
jgi:hypothetical protein